jgi:hypothetical protein
VKCVSTRKAAKLVGIDRSTIEKWIRRKRVEPPPVTLQGRRRVRCWNEQGLARLRQLKKSWEFRRDFWDLAAAIRESDRQQRKKAQDAKALKSAEKKEK